MICRYLVQPRGKRSSLVVLVQFASQFHENFHGGIFGVFPRRQSPPAEPEYRRRIVVVQLAPGVGVTRPGTGYRLRRFRCSRRVHPAWFLRSHRLVRTRARKYYILQIRTSILPRANPLIFQRLGPILGSESRFCNIAENSISR
jgi:hypothetical protein